MNEGGCVMNLSEKYKKALVTGGAGFIGSHIVEGLLEQGIEVVSVDSYIGGKKENLTEQHNRYGRLLTELNVDVTDYNALKPCFGGVDIVFHEAASKKTICLNDPRMDLLINGTGTFNVLELSRDFGIKKLVHASTGSVYGEAIYCPQDEEHPLNPTSYYGVSKLAGEKYVRAFCDLYDMDCTVLRYFHVYGPRQENSDVGGVVSIFGRRAYHSQPLVVYGDGSQQRSFTYVKDVVRANFLVAINEATKGEAYNCASGVNVTINELVGKVKKYYKKEDVETEYKDWAIGDIKVFDVSNEKLKRIGFDFKWSFDAGLTETFDWLTMYLEKSSAN